MKQYTDEGVIPQNLFKHEIAPWMSSLISNVLMMLEDLSDFPDWAEHELAPGYNVREALQNMEMSLAELRTIHKEFIEYLNTKEL